MCVPIYIFWANLTLFLPKPLLARVLRRIAPLELCGGPGDVVFWHGRMVHSVGQHTGERVRIAVPCDFQQARG